MRETNVQMSQVSSLLLNPSPPIFSSTTTAPNVVTSAAASLTADLHTSLGQSNYGYSGLTIDQLRANPAIATEAAALLANATRDVPSLNPLSGMGAALGLQTTIR